ncbi:MAG: hypothetical protein SangKO_099980 [Sandaracinaceae bacterium]
MDVERLHPVGSVEGLDEDGLRPDGFHLDEPQIGFGPKRVASFPDRLRWQRDHPRGVIPVGQELSKADELLGGWIHLLPSPLAHKVVRNVESLRYSRP